MKIKFIQFVVTASILLAAGLLSLTVGFSSYFGFNLPYGQLMLVSIGLIGAGLIVAAVFKARNNRPRPDLDD